MGKSVYYEPLKILGEKEQPQIIVDAMAIYDLLVRAEMMMTKVNRVRYCNRAIEQIQDVIKEFYLSYDFEDDKRTHLERMTANIAVFLITMRIIADRNVICVSPNPLNEYMTPDQVKHELMEHIARLDEGATKWRNSYIKAEKDNKGSKGTSGILNEPAVSEIIKEVRLLREALEGFRS